MKEFIGKIVAADNGDKTITIQCESVAGTIMGQEVILTPVPPKLVKPVDSYEHQNEHL